MVVVLEKNTAELARVNTELKQDIAKRKQTEKALRESEAQKKAILDGITTNLAFVNENLEVNGQQYRVTCLSMGNPHCVIFVNNVDAFPVCKVGPLIENHKAFPKRTNVGFAHVASMNEMNVRVWERGCGETLACGTGVCAAVAAANKLGKVGDKVDVHVDLPTAQHDLHQVLDALQSPCAPVDA